MPYQNSTLSLEQMLLQFMSEQDPTAKSRSETALLQVIQEAYINGISTRKIKKLAQSLGIELISRGQVSQITCELNEQVEDFRSRLFKKTYPVL